MPNFSIVFIIGEGHSGSTLLARMLDMHPQVICGGEMLRLETALVRKHPRQSFTLHYEDLVAAPEQTLRGLGEFVGLPFDPAMLTPDNRTHHFIRASTSGYLKGGNTLRRDERWRQELTPPQLDRIGRMLGDLACYDRYRLTERPD